MNKSKYIKAAFLLLVFSMNTLVGLACSIGFTIGSSERQSHTHAAASEPGATHDHGTSMAHSHNEVIPPHSHAASVPHSHERTVAPHDHGNSTIAKSEPSDKTANDCEGDNCCTDDVVKLSLIDKALTSANIDGLTLPQQVEFLLSAFVVSIYTKLPVFTKVKPPNLRSWPLATHTDLRIAIQSFQI